MNTEKINKRVHKAIYIFSWKSSAVITFNLFILFTGFNFLSSFKTFTPWMLTPIMFTAFLLLASHWKGQVFYRYIFSWIAFAFFAEAVLFYNIELKYLGRFAFCIPLIYSHLLPDVLSPNIAGIMLSFFFSTYFGRENSDYVLIGVIGSIYGSVAFSIIFNLLRNLTEERDKYHKKSVTDSMTGLSTLEYFMEEGRKILEKSSEAALLLIDLDHFKQINDIYGHLAGNKVLLDFSNFLRKEMMNNECIIGRLGGDEFVILLCDCSADKAGKIINRMELSFRNNAFYTEPNLPPLRLSFTIGAAHFKNISRPTIQELLNQADINMYYNKFGDYKLPFRNMFEEIKLEERCEQLLRTLEEKDMYTYIHSRYTAQYATELAVALGFPESSVKDIYISALMHDMGKLFIPNYILRKPGKLTREEYSIIKGHVKDGLSALKDTQLTEKMLNGILYHHEKFDGTGYPNGIKGSDTPVEGRIIQIADAFSAMTIKRVYRDNLSVDRALLELKNNSGTQFDPVLAKTFIGLFSKK